jgi:3',5'-cyclic AMP phosphodiesterase CpdA
MTAWTTLKNAVAAIIKTNNNKEITGALLQSVLHNIIDNVGLNSSFKGLAVPATTPGTPDGNEFYLAQQAGTYANFGGITLNGMELVVLNNISGSWVKTRIGVSSLLQNLVVMDAYNNTYNNIDIDSQTVTLKKEGITIIYGTTSKSITGAVNYVFTRTGTRKYLYLNMEVLNNNADNPIDYTTSNLLIESTDSLTNNQNYVLLCAFYINELQSLGLLAPIINKMKMIYGNMNPLTYNGDVPNSLVQFNTTDNTITFPPYFTVFANGVKYQKGTEQVIPIICKSYPGRIETASSLGFLVMNRDTKEIFNCYHTDYPNLGNKWIIFGIVKRNTSALISSPIQVTGNFKYTIDGGELKSKYLMNPAFYFGSSSNKVVNVNTSANSITFPSGFTVFGSDGLNYDLAEEQIITIRNTYYDTGLPTSSATGVLVLNKTDKVIKNIYWGDWKTKLSDDYLTIGIVKRSTGSLTVVGDVQIIGLFPYSINGGNASATNSIIERNIDLQSLFLSAIFPKYSGGSTKRFNFIHTSDIHSDAVTTQNFINFLNAYSDISQAFISGDFSANDYSEDVTSLIAIMNGSQKPVYTTIGNHDVGNSKIIADSGTNAQVYARYIQPFETKAGMITNGKNYWYKDDTTYKIRIISLYEYDDPNDIDSLDNTKYKITRGFRVYSQSQVSWFIDLLQNTPVDYGVLVVVHHNPTTITDYMVVNENWISPGTWNPQNLINGNIIPDIIEAFRTGTAINQTYTFSGDAAYLGTITANTSFVARGVGEFIAYIFGHHHKDGIGTFTTYPNQNWIAVTCGTVDAQQTQFDDIPRVANTKTEDAFNLISIDREERKIRVVRIGSNFTKNLTERKYITINY